MATKLCYLEDFDVTTCAAKVVRVQSTNDGRTSVVLDQTCFYPRGGGQDWDKGTIDDFVVEEVRLDENGEVHHIGQSAIDWPADKEVNCRVDVERRNINTRLHSAGHVVDWAVSEFEPDWVPSKGAHYIDWCAVEYTVGDIQLDSDLQQKAQAKVDELTQSDYQNKLLFMSPEEMTKYCRHVPHNLPINKPSRIVLYADDFGIPCGGTHVKTLKDIGKIHISTIKVKKGVAKVGYSVEGIN